MPLTSMPNKLRKFFVVDMQEGLEMRVDSLSPSPFSIFSYPYSNSYLKEMEMGVFKGEFGVPSAYPGSSIFPIFSIFYFIHNLPRLT